MTKSELISELSYQCEQPKPVVSNFLEVLAVLAYAEAKNGFLIPGLGKLVLVDRKARMGRNPATGEAIQIPAKKVVKFKVLKICKESILPAKFSKPSKIVSKKKSK